VRKEICRQQRGSAEAFLTSISSMPKIMIDAVAWITTGIPRQT